MPKPYKRFSFNRISIQTKLPLLICALLLSAILIFSFAIYYSLKDATLKTGKERLNALTNELSSMLAQSAQLHMRIVHASATQNSVKQNLKSGGRELRAEALAILDKLHQDSTWVSVDLLDSNRRPVLRSNKSKVNVKVNINDLLSFTPVGPGEIKVGKIYNIKGTMYYPTIASVSEEKHVLGYILSWELVHNSPETVEQLSQLMGTGATLLIGNIDGSLWTDMITPVSAPPFDIKNVKGLIEYADSNNKQMMAQMQAIPGANWLVLVEFSEQTVLEGVNRFVRWIVAIGLVLIVIGVFAAWTMSRSITKPLGQLTVAAEAISQGDYSTSVPVDVYRSDELGKLAIAFNIMTAQVHHMWQDLDHKVKERTSQLEMVNKELEAFSYSISHDLRTPLRAISGYSIMLKEDYEGKLDAEGNRIIHNIITNAKMMGQLIDDLLSFSRLGKKELKRTHVDMQLLAATVVNELLQNEPENKYKIHIGLLPSTEADQVMIKQVLINLLSNAIKYSSKRAGPEIEIGSKDDIVRTIYYIKDNGAGFDMAYAGKLFGVFQRLHSHEEFEGTGVGLALVKRIIDKHKGDIWTEALENIGATFYFSLPK